MYAKVYLYLGPHRHFILRCVDVNLFSGTKETIRCVETSFSLPAPPPSSPLFVP